MNPFDMLPRRIAVIDPSIRIGNAVARRMVNASQAIELLRTGNYRQHFSVSGEFLGIVFGLQAGDRAIVNPRYIPEELPPYELPNVKFIQPASTRIPLNERTVTHYAFP